VSLLLEVKNRIKDSIEALARIQRGEKDPDGTAPAPTHDPFVLFKNVESKFMKRESCANDSGYLGRDCT
jgi:hypothetical protein